jgi:D-serine deaminase-like pyridoxal phosphate-dependent protein
MVAELHPVNGSAHAPRKPAAVGDPVDRIETPALLVDLATLERNIMRMAAGARATGVALRPHAKSHKSATIARMQVAAGAVGVCCQKVAEAEAMARGGIADIYVSNQVVAPQKLARLARVAAQARVMLAFDSAEGVDAAGCACRSAGTQIDALVELDLGDERAGVPAGDPTVVLARRIANTDGLHFAGLQAYKSTAQHSPTAAERKRLALEAASMVQSARMALANARLECRVVSGGGTGSWRYDAESRAYNEVQPGSYVFMDAYYSRISDESGGAFHEFENALFLLASVTSVPAASRALVDEHGRLRWPAGGMGLRIDERIWLVPGNCDPTVNLHDWLVGVRDGRVEQVWAVDARGPGF